MKTVTAAIAIDKGRILLARRAPDEKLPEYWEFPGGKVENGESLQDCLKRELKEELGVNAKIGEQIAESIYEYSHGVFKLIGLMVEFYSLNFELSVHDRVEWVETDQLLTYRLAPADIPIARTIMENNYDIPA